MSEISVSPKKASYFLRVLNIGDRIQDIAFFGLGTVTKGAGIVRHKDYEILLGGCVSNLKVTKGREL